MADINNTIPGNRSHAVGGSDSLSVNANLTVNVGKDSVEVTAMRRNMRVGKTMSIQVADMLEIVVGDARLVLKKDGSITLSGKDITLAASGDIQCKAGRNLVMKGSKIAQN